MAQSAPHLAVAPAHDIHGLLDPGDLHEGPLSHPRALTSTVVPRAAALEGLPLPPALWLPTAEESVAMVEAAVRAEPAGLAEPDPASVWQEMLDGRLVFVGDASTAARRLVALVRMDVSDSRRKLNRIETQILVRVLCGEQQKAAALDLDIACSTASKWCTEGLDKLRLDSHRIALPLVLAAQAWSSGRTLDADARSLPFEHAGHAMLVFSVAAATGRAGALTLAELEVAKLVIDGASRWEIAKKRQTSPQTVACQLRGVYAKLRVRGRHDLIHHAEQAGWFR
jgi:DNA-binding CsgD family transcriptional regulator